MKIEIREFRHSDKNTILNLFNSFGDFFKSIDSLNLVYKADGYAEFFYKEMIENVRNFNGKIYVAEEGNIIVGFIAGNIKDYNKNPSVEVIPHIKGRVLELFIDEKYRGKGIGKMLMKKLEEHFKENNCNVINIEVFAENKDAYKFYKSLGYLDRNIDLIKKIN